jgi:hypothetical protein
MDSFLCHRCSRQSYVRSVLCADNRTYFKCEHCGAEHEVRVIDTPRDQPTEFEIVGVRPRSHVKSNLTL